jgi:hypothetical protein
MKTPEVRILFLERSAFYPALVLPMKDDPEAQTKRARRSPDDAPR